MDVGIIDSAPKATPSSSRGAQSNISPSPMPMQLETSPELAGAHYDPFRRQWSEEIISVATDHGRRRTGKMYKCVNHLFLNAFVLILLFVDLSVLVLRITLNWHEKEFFYFSMTTLGFYLLEILLRLCGLGWREFVRNKWQVLDALLVVLSVIGYINMYYLTFVDKNRGFVNDFSLLTVYCARIFARLMGRGKELCSQARELISSNKRRYVKHGFNLDLTYVTDRVVAMGLPSTGVSATYRNPIDKVSQFFRKLHPDHYMIYNLCSERYGMYDDKTFFSGRVVRFPFDDHNPPTMAAMLRFCTHVEEFLNADPLNIVAVHCKGGKGRTGTMICAWFLYSRKDFFSEQAMQLFARRRVDEAVSKKKYQGVSGPSQIRFVEYFELLRMQKFAPGISDNKVVLKAPKAQFFSVTLHNVRLRKKADKIVTQQLEEEEKWKMSEDWSLVITHHVALPPPSDRPAPTAEELEEQARTGYVFTVQKKTFLFKAKDNQVRVGEGEVHINLDSWETKSDSLTLAGDLKLEFFQGIDLSVENGAKSKPELFCWLWLHTGFLRPNARELVLRKPAIDEACKRKSLDPEFNVRIAYKLLEEGHIEATKAPSAVNGSRSKGKAGPGKRGAVVSRTTPPNKALLLTPEDVMSKESPPSAFSRARRASLTIFGSSPRALTGHGHTSAIPLPHSSSGVGSPTTSPLGNLDQTGGGDAGDFAEDFIASAALSRTPRTNNGVLRDRTKQPQDAAHATDLSLGFFGDI
eukprot:gb/GEZN01001177.1/.p1 GENE.gb/GEZN01001177.1/~~gb/GEZN01001177.1/.p1  ORF type:complete len:749 (+),score=109.88 gb/GEZN01001177.1/:828-3074(+)